MNAAAVGISYAPGLGAAQMSGRNPSRKKKPRASRGTEDRSPAATPAESWLDRYLVLLLFLALISLTLLSAETPLLVGLLGLALCVAGIAQGPVKVDLWVLIPLITYQVLSLISFFLTFGSTQSDMVAGFAATQAFYPVFYLLMAYLDEADLLFLKRLCVLWAGGVAAAGLAYFAFRAVTGHAARLGFIFGNPNAFGIFLAVSWFVLRTCGPGPGELENPWPARLTRLEPLILAALALTLSMGSFLSMAVGILVLAVPELRRKPWREAFTFTCGLLARASIGIGIGVLAYIAARRTGLPWMCVPVLLLAAAAALFWDQVTDFLRDFPAACALAAAAGVLVAAAAILVRPSAVDTFAERLAMMRNGLGYLTAKPLFGLGPYQWYLYNLHDSDIFYNTYHIHNVILHIGVELGIPAMVMAVTVLVRRFLKKSAPGHVAGFAAYVAHNLMDTSFFYWGVTSMALMTVAEPQKGGRKLPAAVPRLIFVMFGSLFAAYALWGRAG